MSKITIYPYFNTSVNIESFRKIITVNGFTIKLDANGNELLSNNTIEINQTLTSAQATTIKDIFKGSAFVEIL